MPVPQILKSIVGYRLGLTRADRLVIGQRNRGIALAVPYVAGAASAAVTNTVTETLFDKNYTFPANTLEPEMVIKLKWQGIATATNATDTLAIRVRIGGLAGTLLFTHAATDVANNDVFSGEYELVIRTIGVTGTVVGFGTGKAVAAAEGTATYKDDILASTTIDTTAAQLVGVTAQWSVANAGNSCRLDFFKVEIA